MTKTYTCDLCGETFDSDYPDEDAKQETAAIFGSIPDDDLAVVCDDCFQLIDPRKPENAAEFAAWKSRHDA